ncbi:serine/threonine-protein kinase [Actinomadura fulvescens]|uniref:non-specific serine/threonine protein kinase n=1 Tax=Actinomadura fulvescens TaxID=46160 RepID=A0ABP6BXS1_9ACTN
MTDWSVSGFTEIRELGRGAQGRVVLARHAERGTPVAIKYLPADADPEAQERFRYEARMLGQVDNPHVARLYRLVESDEGIAIIMEAVEGVAFKTVLERHGKLEPEAALAVLKGSLAGLAAAHAAGVVHRDYKPANVVVRADGLSKLIDFGVAVLAGTTAGSGTPVYMAPEQWRGGAATPATDVYAATCVFFECVTGERPYRGDLAALRHAHLDTPVPLDEVDEPLRHLVGRGMAKEAAQRPASASAFIAELEETARRAYGPDWESRGVRVLAGTALTLAALFPLAAAGLAPAGAAAAAGSTAATTSTGVFAALGTKATVAVAGTAVAGTSAGVFGVYEVAKPDDTRRPAATATTLAPGRDVSFGNLSVRLPLDWKSYTLPVSDPRTRKSHPPNFRVNVPGQCRIPKFMRDLHRKEGRGPEDSEYYNNYCPSFAVIRTPYSNDGRTGWHTFDIKQIFGPETDVSHVCPPRPDLFAVQPITLVKRGLAPVGGRQAEYREWRIGCVKATSTFTATDVSFVQRVWYLPQSKVLIVDEWNTPGLAAILQKATWTA